MEDIEIEGIECPRCQQLEEALEHLRMYLEKEVAEYLKDKCYTAARDHVVVLLESEEIEDGHLIRKSDGTLMQTEGGQKGGQSTNDGN